MISTKRPTSYYSLYKEFYFMPESLQSVLLIRHCTSCYNNYKAFYYMQQSLQSMYVMLQFLQGIYFILVSTTRSSSCYSPYKASASRYSLFKGCTLCRSLYKALYFMQRLEKKIAQTTIIMKLQSDLIKIKQSLR